MEREKEGRASRKERKKRKREKEKWRRRNDVRDEGSDVKKDREKE